jgi:glutathione peroxidase-family protein
MQDKLEVNGPGAHPLYQFLRQQQPVSAPGQARPVPGGGGPGAIEW